MPNDASAPHEPEIKCLFLKIGDVAKMLNCSVMSITRMSINGDMPRPAQMGGMRRWSRAAIEQWIADGCKPVTDKK